MQTKSTEFEQFLLLFGQLKATAGTAARLTTFYAESAPIRRAVSALESFLMRSDFERRVFHGRKQFKQVPSSFDDRWKEYKDCWQHALNHLKLVELVPMLDFNPDSESQTENDNLDPPDPETDTNFDPMYHDGGAAIETGIEYLEQVYELQKDGEFEEDERAANICRIGLDAFEYLKNTIRIDLSGVFQRWRRVPIIFMPAAVSNAHESEKGSLHDLLDDAIRAYVCGAPAAAMAMCRAALEQILKAHYLDPSDYTYKTKKNEEREKGLESLISLAEKRFEHIRKEKLSPRVRLANNIMHDYSRQRPLDPRDDHAIRDFLLTLKTLIEKAGKQQ